MRSAIKERCDFDHFIAAEVTRVKLLVMNPLRTRGWSARPQRVKVNVKGSHDSGAVHRDLEPVGRVTPCAPQFARAQTASRGPTRPTFRFMESPL